MFNLSISPPQIEIIVPPGGTYLKTFDIKNNGDQTVILNSSVLPWLPTDTDGHISYQNVPTSNFVEFSLTNANLKLGQDIKLDPGQKFQFVLKIKTTPDTPPSDFYYTFFVNQAVPSVRTGRDLSLPNTTNLARLGAHILLSTCQDKTCPEPSAEIQNFTIQPPLKDILLTPINLTGQVQNTSDHFFFIDGTITIYKNGQKIKTLTLYPDNVLAGHARSIRCLSDSKDNPAPLTCTLPAPLWPGQYSASLTLNQPEAQITIGFFIFPWSILLGLFLLGLMAKFFLFKKKKT